MCRGFAAQPEPIQNLPVLAAKLHHPPRVLVRLVRRLDERQRARVRRGGALERPGRHHHPERPGRLLSPPRDDRPALRPGRGRAAADPPSLGSSDPRRPAPSSYSSRRDCPRRRGRRTARRPRRRTDPPRARPRRKRQRPGPARHRVHRLSPPRFRPARARPNRSSNGPADVGRPGGPSRSGCVRGGGVERPGAGGVSAHVGFPRRLCGASAEAAKANPHPGRGVAAPAAASGAGGAAAGWCVASIASNASSASARAAAKTACAAPFAPRRCPGGEAESNPGRRTATGPRERSSGREARERTRHRRRRRRRTRRPATRGIRRLLARPRRRFRAGGFFFFGTAGRRLVRSAADPR